MAQKLELISNARFRSLDPTTTILVSEPAAIRRNFATEHGATQVFDPTKDNIPVSVGAVVSPGVDIAFDAAGIQASLDVSLFSLRVRGTYVNVAIWEQNATLNVNLLLAKELNITGAFIHFFCCPWSILTQDRFFEGINGYDRIHEEVISLVAAGKIAGIERLITKKISLDNVVEEGFKPLLREKDKHG